LLLSRNFLLLLMTMTLVVVTAHGGLVLDQCRRHPVAEHGTEVHFWRIMALLSKRELVTSLVGDYTLFCGARFCKRNDNGASGGVDRERPQSWNGRRRSLVRRRWTTH